MTVATGSAGKRAVRGRVAANMFDISYPTWCRRVADGSVPAPQKCGRCVFWLVSDLELWAAHGCPKRDRFEQIKRGESTYRPAALVGAEYRSASPH